MNAARFGWTRLAAAIALAILCALQLFALLRAPSAWLPARVAVMLARGAAVTLDDAALGAPSGDARLILRRDAAGGWWAAGADAAHPLLVQDGARQRRSGSAPLVAGQRFQLGAAHFSVDAATGAAVAFSRHDDANTDANDGRIADDGAGTATGSGAGADDTNRRASITQWRYDGAVLRRGGAVQALCPESGLGARVSTLWNRIAPSALAFARPLVFGGNLDCGNRIAIAGLAAHAASMLRGADGLVLASAAGTDAAPLLLTDAGPVAQPAQPALLAERALRLGSGQVLIAGRTHLLLEPNGDVLHLRPLSHVALYADAQRRLPEGVTWTWTRRAAWQWPAAATAPLLILVGLALAAALAVLLKPRRRGIGRARVPGTPAASGMAWRTAAPAVQATYAGAPPATRLANDAAARMANDAHAATHSIGGTLGSGRLHAPARVAASAAAFAGAILLTGLGVTLFWLQRSGAPAGAAVSMLVAWAALWYALLAPRRLEPALAAAVLLLAVGLLAQLDLGLGAPESSWLRHFQKTAALLALGGGGVALLRFVLPVRPLAQARIEIVLLMLTGCALVALLLQVAYGDETGVFDLQPVEFAKLALTALSAHCLALASAGQSGSGSAWLRALRLVAPALLFMLLLAVALMQVDDYSPLVLLLIWGGAMALAQALATRQRGVTVLLLALACGAVLAVALLRGAGADGIARWDFYADRFLVWLDPGAHPHTGQQLLLGAHAIADGGWWGADGMLGLRTLGQDPGFALRVPAVQDDFAASFFLQRHGLVAALGLWLLQALFLAGLLQLAVRCWLQGAAARDFRLAWLARVRCFFLTGGAAFAFGHFLLSWGTNLAIFPVMGQPMSFLSAGGSHLLFFICPLLGVAAASGQSLEENESCRSTSNMKS